ncbi:MAG: O-antigen ligase family protein [Anaerocolumna aminovalerica]|uniref:O-antigen ligase family protein n=1 Tax=Anaerocolumna aminovalerica TaxID=1527 RepID=UPI00290A74A5|nr:O-antigen ligase family protein [Anaerocolumna aminovalerica]MDU6265947.1 O-antigen ligase family protein [Anaerocolumna aminovalerica]
MNNLNYNAILCNKKYIIRIPKDISALLIFGVATAFMALRTIVPFLYGIQLIFLMYMGVKGFYNANQLFTNKYVIVYGLFLIWCCFSFLWSPAMDKTMKATISIAQIIVICSLMTLYLVNLENLERVLFGFAIASLLMIGFLLLRTRLSEWMYVLKGSFSASTDKGRIGYSIGHHPNAMGNLCASLALVWLYFYDKKKRKRYLICMLLLCLILLFTKSRGAILMVAMHFFGYAFLRKKRRFTLIKIIPLIIVSSFLLYKAIFHIPFLYELIGFRIEGIFGLFSSSYSIDASSYTRINMMKYGLDMFIKHPVTGVGFGNYGYYAYNYYGLFTETYAHSNYIEILAGLGVIGIFLYYILPVLSCITLGLALKKTDRSNRKLCAFLFLAISVRLITDLIKITYNDEVTQMLNVICICGGSLINNYNKQAGET